MNNSFLSSRALMGAAIVGLVGAAGVFIYEQVYAEKRRAMLGQCSCIFSYFTYYTYYYYIPLSPHCRDTGLTSVRATIAHCVLEDLISCLKHPVFLTFTYIYFFIITYLPISYHRKSFPRREQGQNYHLEPIQDVFNL